MKRKIKIGISPCPNDTYIFHGIINNKINTDLDFEFSFADVEVLNHRAMDQSLDVCKLSFNAYGHVQDKYQLFDSGSALGKGCGPLLIGKANSAHHPDENTRIAIPGEYTTANLLLTKAFPNAINKSVLLFSDIENAIINDDVDLGLIIHETRFTFTEKGLIEVFDLGKYWEDETNMPLPLGGIACLRTIDQSLKQEINLLISKSIAYADANVEETLAFCQQYAQEMEPEVLLKHIQLYVNEYSKQLGELGRKAILMLLGEMSKQQRIKSIAPEIFIPSAPFA